MKIRLRATVRVWSLADATTESAWQGTEVKVREVMRNGEPWLIDNNDFGLPRGHLRQVPYAELIPD